MVVGIQACVGPKASPSAPRIAVDEAVYDFGAVEQGTRVTHRYGFRNVGGLALNIDNVRSSCGCTATVASARVLPPGGGAVIEVLFDTAGASGYQSKTVSVYSNDPAQPVATLTLTGRVTADIAADPPQLYVGHLRRGQAAFNSLSLTGEAAVTSVETTGEVIDSTLSGAASGGKRVQVAAKKSAALGRFEETITVRTGSHRQPQLSIPVTGIVDGDIVASPAQLNFGLTAPDARASRVVGLQNRGSRPMRVTAARLLPPIGTAAVSVDQEGKDYRITVTLTAGLRPGKILGTLEVETDSPEQSHIEVPLSGRVAERS
jgi:hypothetical protein